MKVLFFIFLVWVYPATAAVQRHFVDVVEEVTDSVGAIALMTPLESNAPSILGTGFVVTGGKTVITNYHVVEKPLDPSIVQYFVFLSGTGQIVKQVKAEVAAIDPLHDLAVLTLEQSLPALTLGDSDMLPPGSDIAFTGFPIGAALGLYPATHKGIVAAITPDVIPVASARQLTLEMLKREGRDQLLYQLDATAFPGNSGSPVYEPATGRVIGIINKVIVKDTKESALSSPSGISYAVPVKYILKLLERANQ